MKKVFTPLFIICCLQAAVPVRAQQKAAYVLGGGALTVVNGKAPYSGSTSWYVNGMALTGEAGVLLNKNTIGLQYVLRLNGDLELIHDYSIVLGRQLVAEKKFSLSLHAGAGLERFVIEDSYDRNPAFAVFPVYADLRFGLSKNPATRTSVWIGLRGGRYFSLLRPFTVAQLNLVIVAPWH